MKKRFNIIILVVSVLSSFIIGFGSAYGVILYRTINISKNASSNGIQRFISVYSDINQGYYKKVNSDKLVDHAINGMLKYLDDPYTQYIGKNQMESFNNNISGNVSGIGVVVTNKKNKIVINSVVNNSPAQKSGIKKNDIIKKINNKRIKNMSLDEVSSDIKGKTGTSVNLTLQRGDKLIKKNVMRKKLSITSVNWNIDKTDKSVGYIQISEFTDNTAKDLKKSLIQLNNKKVKRVIIDLRSNPGGELDQAIQASSMFLKNDDKIVSTKDRNGKTIVYKASSSYNHNFKYHKDVVLLVNSNTASAAEVFTAALHENNNTPIVGTKTFGKGIVQSVVPIDSTSELKYTSSKWLTPKNNWIHHKGIEPTVKIPADPIENGEFVKNTSSKLGDQNADIKFANSILKRLGYDVEQNNNFTQNTKNALIDYQRKNNIKQSGELDDITKESLIFSLSKILKENDNVYKKALEVR